MIPYYGDYPEDHTEIRIPFNTFNSDDPSGSVTITDLVDGDIQVHADGDTTQIATDGASIIINFAGETGAHMVLIDSSADAAYTTGTEYAVKIVGVTVDGATLNVWIGTFSIERAGGVLALLKALTTKQDSDMVLVDADHDKTQSDILLLSGKADSDMVLAIADHDKTQSDIVLLSGKADSDMVLAIADHDKTQSDIVLLSGKADSDMTLVLAQHTKTQSDIVIVASDTLMIEENTISIITGTAQSVTASDITLAGAETFAENEMIGATVYIKSASTGAGQSRVIADYGVVDDRADLESPWATTPTGTVVYVLFPTAPSAADTEITAMTSNLLIMASDVAVIEATGGLTVAQASDLVAIESEMILVHSETTIVASDAIVLTTKVVALTSNMVIVASDTVAIESELILVHSETTIVVSDTAEIEATGGTLTVAQASDLVALESELILVHSETTIVASDIIVLATSLASLSTKQDSDMLVVGAGHTKTQSDIVIVDDLLDTEIPQIISDIALLTAPISDIESSLVIAKSDLVVAIANVATLSTKQDSDMVVVAAGHTKTQSDIVIVASDTLAIEVATTGSIAELAQGKPTATPTMIQALMLPYMMIRNKLTSTATVKAVYNDAGTVIAKSTLSDDATTFTDAEMVAGP